jgi:hypothetical protein
LLFNYLLDPPERELDDPDELERLELLDEELEREPLLDEDL